MHIDWWITRIKPNCDPFQVLEFEHIVWNQITAAGNTGWYQTDFANFLQLQWMHVQYMMLALDYGQLILVTVEDLV